MKMHKTAKKKNTYPILTGLIAAAITGLGGCVVAAMLIQKEYLALERANTVAIVLQFLSSLLGAILCGKAAGEQRLTACLWFGGIYIAILTLSAMLFFNGVCVSSIIDVLVCTVGCVGGFFVSVTRKKPKFTKTIKKAYR